MVRIPIVFICDNGYVMPTITAINSLMANKSEDTQYITYIVTADLDEVNTRYFTELSSENKSIEIIRANTEKIKGIHKNNKESFCVASEAALLKFFLPELLPHEDKIIYLDGDIIIQKDLKELYQTNIANYYAGVVIDSGSIYYKHEYVKKVEHYFNSGVMVLNLEKLRQDNISDKLLETKKESNDSSLMDQNVFNVVFDKKIKLLPIKYNFLLVNLNRSKGKYTISDINATYFTEYKNISEIQDDAYIIHYSSKDKPWIYSDVIGSDIWYRYFLQTNLFKINRKMCSVENQHDILVSVIIPVYNVENYLDETLKSVLSQTLSNIEIICVNDGSTDASGNILKKYSERDDRLIIIEQENMGQSVARNNALTLAKGEYIYFLDSDDIIAGNALENLYSTAKEKNVDVLLFDGESFFESKVLQEKHSSYKTAYQRKNNYPKVLNGKAMYIQMVENGDYKVSPCLQFFRRAFLNAHNIRFYEGIIYEDNLFSFYCMMYAERVFHIPKILFYRRVRANSVMTATRGRRNYIGYYTCVREILNYVHENNLNTALLLQINKQLCGYMGLMDEIYDELEENEKEVDICYPYYTYLDVMRPLRNVLITNNNGVSNIENNMIRKDELIKQYYGIDSLEKHKILNLFLYISRKVVGGMKCYHEHGVKYTIKRTYQKIRKKLKR